MFARELKHMVADMRYADDSGKSSWRKNCCPYRTPRQREYKETPYIPSAPAPGISSILWGGPCTRALRGGTID